MNANKQLLRIKITKFVSFSSEVLIWLITFSADLIPGTTYISNVNNLRIWTKKRIGTAPEPEKVTFGEVYSFFPQDLNQIQKSNFYMFNFYLTTFFISKNLERYVITLC